jgi:hypothetical protein
LTRCPTCRAEHCLDPDLLRARLAEYRSAYQDWRKGGAKGSKGELVEATTAAPRGPSSPPPAMVSAVAAPAAPPAKQLPDTPAPPTKILVSGSTAWLCAVVAAAPETLPTVALFVHALISAALLEFFHYGLLEDGNVIGSGTTSATAMREVPRSTWLPIFLGVALSLLAMHPRCVAAVDHWVPSARLFEVCGLLHAGEGFGLALVAAGALWGKLGSPSLSCDHSTANGSNGSSGSNTGGDSNLVAYGLFAVGIGVTSQLTQTFRLQRKTTGTQPVDDLHKALLVVKSHMHHLGSFVYLGNVQTALFVACWRWTSISGHIPDYLNGKVRALQTRESDINRYVYQVLQAK